jgi:hypothetical protein
LQLRCFWLIWMFCILWATANSQHTYSFSVKIFCSPAARYIPALVSSIWNFDQNHINSVLTPVWGISTVRPQHLQHMMEKYGKNIRVSKMFMILDSSLLTHITMRHRQHRPLCRAVPCRVSVSNRQHEVITQSNSFTPNILNLCSCGCWWNYVLLAAGTKLC